MDPLEIHTAQQNEHIIYDDSTAYRSSRIATGMSENLWMLSMKNLGVTIPNAECATDAACANV